MLVANFDIPKGYKTIFWGTRKRWRDTKEGEDYAMTFRSNGGVIDPTTHKEGSQMQFMSCPGPNERMNMRSTNEFFGATYEKGLVGREFVVTEDIPKNHQLLIWYGAQWFDARDIKRIDVGTKRQGGVLRCSLSLSPIYFTFDFYFRTASVLLAASLACLSSSRVSVVPSATRLRGGADGRALVHFERGVCVDAVKGLWLFSGVSDYDKKRSVDDCGVQRALVRRYPATLKRTAPTAAAPLGDATNKKENAKKAKA